MYYEERWIDGKFCWRTSPNGAWTAYTANELAHRYQAELQRAHDAQRALATLQAQLRQVEGERDRLRRALEQVSFHLAQPGDDETPHNQYVPSAAEVGTCQVIILAALTPAAGE